MKYKHKYLCLYIGKGGNMKNLEKNIQNIMSIRKIYMATMAIIILTWAFFKNNFVARIIISLFLICSIAILGENIFLLLNKEKISNIFKYIFRVCFFIYVIGFLTYSSYYAIVNKCYSLFIPIAIFIPFTIYFFKKAFPSISKNKKEENIKNKLEE